jgi:hypothetical protein
MPSARIHEAIAREINKEFGMDDILLRIGTVSPDCWRNVGTDSGVKDRYLTHFWDFRIKNGQANNYEEFYLKYYNQLSNPFYFGYLIHLITDQYWKTNIDSKYFAIENGIRKIKLRDGTLREDKDWYSYYEDIKIQKQLCKIYDLDTLPTEIESILNFKCEIDEVMLKGLYGTLNYINNELVPGEKEEKSEVFYIDDFIEHINETVQFIKKELIRLEQLKINNDLKIKIAVDIDDTLLCTKELEEYYWGIFLKDNPNISPYQEYTCADPILVRFWAEYREKIAFGNVKPNASVTLKYLLSKGYRIDLLSARPLEKYTSLKKKMVEYFETMDINYDYITLGFHSKKEILKNISYDILIDNDMKNLEEAESVGVIPILYGPYNPNYTGYQTSNWSEIPLIIENIVISKKQCICNLNE